MGELLFPHLDSGYPEIPQPQQLQLRRSGGKRIYPSKERAKLRGDHVCHLHQNAAARRAVVLPVGIVAFWQPHRPPAGCRAAFLPFRGRCRSALWSLSVSGELWQHLATSPWRKR